jgi:hypothetical protein
MFARMVVEPFAVDGHRILKLKLWQLAHWFSEGLCAWWQLEHSG